jgi:hypothetical protein
VPQPEAFVVLRCSVHRHRHFAARFVSPQAGRWMLVSSGEIDEKRSEQGGYGHQQLSGTIGVAEDAQVCPACGARNVWLCGNCDTLNCWDNSTQLVTCAACLQQAKLSGTIESLGGSIDI